MRAGIGFILIVSSSLFLLPVAGRGQDLEIDLGDVAAGGDGTGGALPDTVGINPDTGLLETSHLNAPLRIGDGQALQPVDDAVSELIDSVFIIESLDMPISSSGVTFSFPPEDLLAPPQTWDHILRDRIGGEDAPVSLGGVLFERGVGIHAAAGITFDLEALRALHGAAAVGEVAAYAGMGDSPGCLATPGSVTAHVIISDGEQVLDFASHRASVGGRWLRLPLPPEARFLTLATGAGNGQFFCNSGVFGGASITPVSTLSARRDLPDLVQAGETVQVAIDLSINIPPVDRAEVRERIPLFFRPMAPSPPGVIETDAEGRETVVWKLEGGVQSRTLTYDLRIPDPYATVSFPGGKVIAGGKEFVIFGDEVVPGGRSGHITEALVVTLRLPTTGCEGSGMGEAAQALDYLNDGGLVREQTVLPAAGESVSPDFGGNSPSPGPAGTGSTTWTRLAAQQAGQQGGQQGAWFELNTCDDCMSYLTFYAENQSGRTLRVRVGVASDDGTQVLVDGREVWNHAIARPSGGPGIQDHSPLFDLTPGNHLVLQKVFEGCGGFNSAIRFEDEDRNPVLLRASLEPGGLAQAPFCCLRDLPDLLEEGGCEGVTLRFFSAVPVESAVIEEVVPAGLLVCAVSDGGVLAGQKIVWSFGGTTTDRTVTYTVQALPGAADAEFEGTATIGGKKTSTLGDRVYDRGAMSGEGFLKRWLVLGPLETSGLWPGDPLDPPLNPDAAGAAPEGGDLRLDYLTDGALGEKTIRPFDGMRISPAFGGDGKSGARATGLEPLSRSCAPAVPTWERFVSRTGTFRHRDHFGEDVESHATYAACYIRNPGAAPISTNLALHSDGAFIAYLNGVEVLAHEPPPCSASACGRGLGAEGAVTDVQPVTLPPGESFLLTRAHGGIGTSGHRLRFQDAAGRPLLPPAIEVSLRSNVSPPPAEVRRSLSSDRYRPGTPLTATLRVEVSGRHGVLIQEVLPGGWSAEDITGGGALSGNQVEWTLRDLTAPLELAYRLVPAGCAGGAAFCGSRYAVDGGAAHALRGDDRFRWDSSGADDLGPWDVRDLGTVAGGTRRLGDRSYDVTGRGAGIKGTRDEFRFISVPASGDFEISARIDCVDDPVGLGQGGLMVRDSFDLFSAHAFFALSSTPPPGGGAGTLRAAFRRETSPTRSSATITVSDRDVPALPVHLKVARKGARLSFQRSADGVAFTEVAQRDIGPGAAQVNLRNDTLIGLAVTAGGGGAARLEFREVSEPPVAERGTFLRGDADANGEIEVTDPVKLLNYLFLGQAKPECLDAADVDDNGDADISDAIANLNYQFLGGPPPAPPGPRDCGIDANLEIPDLGCDKQCE